MTDFLDVPLNRLVPDPLNVRQSYDPDGIEALSASIEANGLAQNLIVRPGKKGRYLVSAGGRRLAALNLLAERQRIAADRPILCLVKTEADATEISLTENIMREPMSPVEEFEAFAKLAAQGKEASEIALRFGTTPRNVKQRLALARVNPELLQLYRNGEISDDELAAFTICDDHAKQLEAWEALPSWNQGASMIRRALTQAEVATNEVPGSTVIDLCAGIGGLAYHVMLRRKYSRGELQRLVCLEASPRFCGIGRKLLPEAEWINADVFNWREWYPALGARRFCCALSNPPFGSVARSGTAPRYSGKSFEFHVLDIAAEIAEYGVFIVPQQSAPFRYSGAPYHERRKQGPGVDFERRTGWPLCEGIGIDCSVFADQWKSTNITVEVVTVDFADSRPGLCPPISKPSANSVQ